jgi:hypothetical protein
MKPTQGKKGKSWEQALADGSFRKALSKASLGKKPNTRVFARDCIVQAPPGSLILSPEEQYVVFAALCTMVDDVHSVQDQMTEKQWELATALYKGLTKLVNDRDKREGLLVPNLNQGNQPIRVRTQ